MKFATVILLCIGCGVALTGCSNNGTQHYSSADVQAYCEKAEAGALLGYRARNNGVSESDAVQQALFQTQGDKREQIMVVNGVRAAYSTAGSTSLEELKFNVHNDCVSAGINATQ